MYGDSLAGIQEIHSWWPRQEKETLKRALSTRVEKSGVASQD